MVRFGSEHFVCLDPFARSFVRSFDFTWYRRRGGQRSLADV